MITIKEALNDAQRKIASDTSGLDAQLLVCKVIKKDRTFCFTYPEALLTPQQIAELNSLVARRQAGEPMAYLLNEKEFWSLLFIVTEDCLIPRPETELIVDWCLRELPTDKKLNIVDLGTGSGAIAISLATERPLWRIAATDISEKALFIAKQNAIRHNTTHIAFQVGSWFDAVVGKQFDVIISNPPYVACRDEKLKYEPSTALYSDRHGLKALERIIEGAPKHLNQNGFLMLEHGEEQQEAVVAFLRAAGFASIKTFCDLAGQDRMVVAKR